MRACCALFRRKPDSVFCPVAETLSVVFSGAGFAGVRSSIARKTHINTNITHTSPRLSLSLEVDTPSRFRESMNNSPLTATKTLALSLKTPASVTGVK